MEHEYKYLINACPDLTKMAGQKVIQGYFDVKIPTVRVRVMTDFESLHSIGFMTIKGPKLGISSSEHEFQIPAKEAQDMLTQFCQGRIINKTRYYVPYQNQIFELDVFEGALDGLIIAELEVSDPLIKPTLPAWIAKDITHHKAFSNQNLATLTTLTTLPGFQQPFEQYEINYNS